MDLIKLNDKSFLERKSFGGNTLQKNIELASDVMVRHEKAEKMFCKGQTAFEDCQLTINSSNVFHYWQQLTNKINSKKDAILEVTYKLERHRIESAKYQALADSEDDELKKADHLNKVREHETSILLSMKYYEAALKRIIMLDNMKAQAEKKIGFTPDEVTFEEAEIKSWIIKAISLALFDMRQTGGIITEGKQSLIERLGFNVQNFRKVMLNYLQQEAESAAMDNKMYFEFCNDFAEKFKHIPSKKIAEINGVEFDELKHFFYTEDDDVS